jgi:hypothetical protein
VQRRKYSYFIRKRVPADLVPVIGKREIVKSLNTLNPEEAKTKAKLMGLEVDQLLEAARNGVSLTLRDAESLADQWKRDRLAEDMDRRATELPRDGLVEDDPSLIARMLDDARDALADRDYRDAHNTVRRILAERGLAVPEQSPGFNRLAQAVTRAKVELLETVERRVAGDLSEPAPEGQVPTPALSPLAAPVVRAAHWCTLRWADAAWLARRDAQRARVLSLASASREQGRRRLRGSPRSIRVRAIRPARRTFDPSRCSTTPS